MAVRMTAYWVSWVLLANHPTWDGCGVLPPNMISDHLWRGSRLGQKRTGQVVIWADKASLGSEFWTKCCLCEGPSSGRCGCHCAPVMLCHQIQAVSRKGGTSGEVTPCSWSRPWSHRLPTDHTAQSWVPSFSLKGDLNDASPCLSKYL